MENEGWHQVRRKYRVARFSPHITFRRGGYIAISADFVRMANISDCTRASLFLSKDGFRLAIQFHSNENDDDGFTLAKDGGGAKSDIYRNRVICAVTLIKQSAVISSILREDKGARRYEPKKDINGRWIVNLIPCFERTLGQSDEVQAGITGIYRYRSSIDTVYIGRGNLRDRFADPARRTWDFNRIEYSVLNDDAAERRWESFWLDEYRRKNGRWPLYNQIGGSAVIQVG